MKVGDPESKVRSRSPTLFCVRSMRERDLAGCAKLASGELQLINAVGKCGKIDHRLACAFSGDRAAVDQRSKRIINVHDRKVSSFIVQRNGNDPEP